MFAPKICILTWVQHCASGRLKAFDFHCTYGSVDFIFLVSGVYCITVTLYILGKQAVLFTEAIRPILRFTSTEVLSATLETHIIRYLKNVKSSDDFAKAV